MTKTLWCGTVSCRLCSTKFRTDKMCAELFSAIENMYLVFYWLCPVLGFATERHQRNGQGFRFLHSYQTSVIFISYYISGTPCTLLVARKIISTLWETVWLFLIILGMELPYEPVILLLGIYSKELKTSIHIYVHSRITHRSQKMETAKVSASEWVNKFSYKHAM